MLMKMLMKISALAAHLVIKTFQHHAKLRPRDRAMEHEVALAVPGNDLVLDAPVNSGLFPVRRGAVRGFNTVLVVHVGLLLFVVCPGINEPVVFCLTAEGTDVPIQSLRSGAGRVIDPNLPILPPDHDKVTAGGRTRGRFNKANARREAFPSERF